MQCETINNLPGRILIGAGSSIKVAEELRDKKTLVITDKGILEAGLADRLTCRLQRFDLFSEINAEPTTDDIDRILSAIGNNAYEAIVGIGGGSALDTAKAVAALDSSVFSAAEAFGVSNLRDPKTRSMEEPPYLVAIPTTAGTGSESTLNAILIDSRDGIKKAIISDLCLPKVAVLDPELTISLPAALTASTGTDALCHCVESLTSVKANPISETFSRRGIQLIEQNLATAVNSPRNLSARENMLAASFWGGAALAIAGTNAIHALAYPLGKRGVPHGNANSMLFMPVMKFNLDACEEKLLSLAARETDAARILRRFGDMLSPLPIPRSVEKYSIPSSELDVLSAEAMEQTRLLGNNLKPLTYEDAKNIYAQLF